MPAPSSKPKLEAVDPEPGDLAEAAGESLTLAEAFSDLGNPTTNAAPAAGAVDIRKITPAKPAAAEKPVKQAGAGR